MNFKMDVSYYLPGWIYRVGEIEPYAKGKGLDIGCYRWPFPRSIAVEPDGNTAQYIKEVIKMPCYKSPGDNLSFFGNESFDYVFSSHCLEHIKEWKKALSEWVRILKKGGYLILYLPHPRRESYRRGVHPSHVNEFVFNDYYSYLHPKVEMIYGQEVPDKWDSQLFIARKL
jgi:SAM-dependent methyltransferase